MEEEKAEIIIIITIPWPIVLMTSLIGIKWFVGPSCDLGDNQDEKQSQK